MVHKASCHCGNIAFEVEGDIDGATACNCSICSRKGSLLWFVSRDRMKLLTPEDSACSYTFNKQLIAHRFCPVCGIHPYAVGRDPKGNEVAAINIRCIEGLDIDAVALRKFDGLAL